MRCGLKDKTNKDTLGTFGKSEYALELENIIESSLTSLCKICPYSQGDESQNI